MIRIVKEFVEQSSILILCDDTGCGNFISRPVPSYDLLDQSMSAILSDAGKGGWSIGIMGSYCGPHVQKMMSQKNDHESRIITPNSGLKLIHTN
jgi:hypothetical protein